MLSGAIILGFAGSIHCIGMCGPIAMALPVHNKSSLGKIISLLLYNLGRALSYALLGGLIGILGHTFIIAGLQQSISIVSGILIIVFFLFEKHTTRFIHSFGWITSIHRAIQKNLAIFLKRKNLQAMFFIGAMNGLLPCGFLYMSLSGALSMGNLFSGSLFMFLFALGTLPAMFAVAYAGEFLSVSLRSKMKKIMPVFILSFGFLLILRGMNLDIPYLSPAAKVYKPSADITQQHCSK